MKTEEELFLKIDEYHKKYYNKEQYVLIHIDKMDKKCIYYECPFCWTKYKKDGTPTIRAKRGRHTHGRGDNVGIGHISDRATHCSKNRRHPILFIDEDTKES